MNIANATHGVPLNSYEIVMTHIFEIIARNKIAPIADVRSANISIPAITCAAPRNFQ
jgi:hypothetical protein